MTSILPRKRSGNQPKRGTNTVLHDLSNKGRVISGRSVSATKRKPSGTRHVSRGDMFVGRGEDDANSSFGEDAIHFHENKSTIMSNFEEWIKLSTDNKITTKNSWQFALIDYFHDLNVIKDGDNINFQRASATLDGCVKIYSSRVESAASETGKLLSGLATKKGQMELEGPEDEAEEDDNENPSGTRKERRINRVVESTLVSFDTLRIKKLDQELAIDPLFKKALAEFDEGGAKSLLLNTLSIDSSGRVVFDATTNSIKQDVEEDSPSPVDNMEVEEQPLDLSKLKSMLLPSDSDLDDFSICPSISELKLVLSDVNKAKTVLSDVNNRFSTDEEDERMRSNSAPPQEEMPDYDFDLDFNGVDENVDEVDIDNIENDIQKNHDVLGSPEAILVNEEVATGRVMDQDLMAYFDEKMKTNWRGPEHWRVTTLKQNKNLEAPQNSTRQPDATPKRKRKEDILIDFFEEDEEDFLENIFKKNKNPYQISKKPEECDDGDFHVLPDDIQFNSQRLVNLFLKPKKAMMTFSKRSKDISNEGDQSVRAYTDQNYFADKYLEQEKGMEEEARQEKLAASFLQAEMEDYDNDNFGGIDFNDVLGGTDSRVGEEDENKNEIGTQLVTGGRKARPEYVNFSKVAKRVDVKLLKDNLWRSIKLEAREQEEPSATPAAETKEKAFTEIVDTIGEMYRPEEKKDLSTSFCFICLLHLANEHGLSIDATENHDDLVIKGF